MADLEFKVNIENDTNTPVSGEAESLSLEQLSVLCQQQAQTIADLRVTIANLTETIANLTRKIYGSSREKLPIMGQLDIFGNEYNGEKNVPEEPSSLLMKPSSRILRKERKKAKDPKGKTSLTAWKQKIKLLLFLRRNARAPYAGEI